MTRGYVDAADRTRTRVEQPGLRRGGHDCEGVNPRRLLNEVDAVRPKTAEQLARDPLTKHYEAVGDTRMADRMGAATVRPRAARRHGEMKHRADVSPPTPLASPSPGKSSRVG